MASRPTRLELLSLYSAVSITHPRLLSIVPGIFAAELPLLFAALDAYAYAYAVASTATNYGVKGDGWWRLPLHAFTTGAFVREWVVAMVFAREDFRRALTRAGVRTVRTPSLTALAMQTVPTWSRARRGMELKRETHRYADVDAELLRAWRSMPKLLRHAHEAAFRGRVSEWTTLDVYVAPDDERPRKPVFLYVHGGGWTALDRKIAMLAWVQRLASRGVLVVSANYTLAPNKPHPAQIIDVKRALVWVKRNAGRWGGDPTAVFVGGESAGGHLSALAAVSGNFPDFQPPECPHEDTSVVGGVPFCGVYDFLDEHGHLRDHATELGFGITLGLREVVGAAVLQRRRSAASLQDFQKASPAWHVRRLLAEPRGSANVRLPPPLFVVHGSDDRLTSIRDAEAFFRSVRDVRLVHGGGGGGGNNADDAEGDVPDVFCSVHGALHGFGYFPSPRAVCLAEATVDFIAEVVRRRRRVGDEWVPWGAHVPDVGVAVKSQL